MAAGKQPLSEDYVTSDNQAIFLHIKGKEGGSSGQPKAAGPQGNDLSFNLDSKETVGETASQLE